MPSGPGSVPSAQRFSGLFFSGEPVTFPRMAFIGLIVIGILGLKAVH